MPLQDIEPINGNLQDTLVQASKAPWIEHDAMSATKVLFTGAETGSWAVLYRWKKGFVAPPHKHLSASHTFILHGKLKVRGAILNTGDYVYEPNAVLHGATEALEDTEYLFICNGPIVFFDEAGLTSYISWEEIEKMRRAAAAPAPAVAAE